MLLEARHSIACSRKPNFSQARKVGKLREGEGQCIGKEPCTLEDIGGRPMLTRER